MRLARRRIKTFGFRLDAVQLGDVAQGLLGLGAGLGLVQLEVAATHVRPASDLGEALGEQGFVARVVVHDQGAAERAEEALGVLAAAARATAAACAAAPMD